MQLIVNIDALLTKFISACHDAAKPSLMRSDRIEDDDDSSRETFWFLKTLGPAVACQTSNLHCTRLPLLNVFAKHVRAQLTLVVT